MQESILLHTRRLRRQVSEKFPQWPVELIKIASGALAMYRLRLVDMFRREYALLLWVIEGDYFMRIHDGSAFMYTNDGAFVAYNGIPPEATFGRVKRFLLRLEGLFRLLPRDVPRKDQALLEGIDTTVNNHPEVETFFNRCEDAAIFCFGSRRRRQAPPGEAAPDGVAEPEGDAPSHWPIITAEALSRVGLQLQKELLEERVYSYLIEWCDTCLLYTSPSPRD